MQLKIIWAIRRQIHFQKIETNALIAALFTFTPPANVDVIDETKNRNKINRLLFNLSPHECGREYLDEFVGQTHFLGAGKPLRRAIEQGILHSMILWGPPGQVKPL